MRCLGFVLAFAIFHRCRCFSNAGLEDNLPQLVRCPFPYYFGFFFMSPASENSSNISLSYSCFFLGVPNVIPKMIPMCSQQPLDGARCLSKLAKLGISRRLHGFTWFPLFLFSTLKDIAYVLRGFMEYSAFQGSATPGLRLPNSPGKPTPSALNGNCPRTPVHQNELFIESRLPSLLLWGDICSLKWKIIITFEIKLKFASAAHAQWPTASLGLHNPANGEENLQHPPLAPRCSGGVFPRIHLTGKASGVPRGERVNISIKY